MVTEKDLRNSLIREGLIATQFRFAERCSRNAFPCPNYDE